MREVHGLAIERGPCDGFEVSTGAKAGEAIRKRREQLRQRRATEAHYNELEKIVEVLPRNLAVTAA